MPVLTEEENELIGDNIDYIALNKISDSLAFPSRSASFSGLIITDRNLDETRRITLDNYPINCMYSNDGSILIASIWIPPIDLPGHEFDESGRLAIIDTNNWSIRYCNLPSYPTNMYITNNKEYIYVTCGFYEEFNPTAKLLKLNTSDCNIVGQTEFGKPGLHGLALSDDETKLYLDTKEVRYENDANNKWKQYQFGESAIRIYYTETLQSIKEIYVDRGISQLINGPDNMIIAAQRATEEGNDASVTIISTISDSIVREINIENTSCYELIYDDYNNYLYANPLVLGDYYDEYNNLNTDWLPNNKVIRLDLSDYSYIWITVAPEDIGAIALSSDSTRIYASSVAPESQKVYYKDLE